MEIIETIKAKIDAFVTGKPYAACGICLIAGFALGAMHSWAGM